MLLQHILDIESGKYMIVKFYRNEELAVLMITIGMSARVRLTLITLRAFDR